MLTVQMSRVLYFLDNQETINYWQARSQISDLPPEEMLLTREMIRMWNLRLFDF
jgi:hypothetical protein